MAEGEFTGPIGHSAWWWLLVVVLVGGPVLGYAGYAWSRWRRRTRGPVEVPPTAVDAPLDPRQAALAELDVLEARVRSGEIGPRDGINGLSAVLRRFAAQATGKPVESMALHDLHRRPALAQVAAVIEVLYPAQFAPAESDRFADGLVRCREVIARWDRATR